MRNISDNEQAGACVINEYGICDVGLRSGLLMTHPAWMQTLRSLADGCSGGAVISSCCCLHVPVLCLPLPSSSSPAVTGPLLKQKAGRSHYLCFWNAGLYQVSKARRKRIRRQSWEVQNTFYVSALIVLKALIHFLILQKKFTCRKSSHTKKDIGRVTSSHEHLTFDLQAKMKSRYFILYV